ncbi:MAG: enoyl-CoA hydratase [Sneathiella sp.]|mgnify:CR=1 FL=1|jgi:enoyl-CoA hydratase/carnithine racemase|uniref:enoyl-CoA hydratase/isomerase family protein n=1 Tax=Sneathiella sp. TaxID=1964365 RepID=UPI000C629D02|nr:enoyl-CoA hydratase/isomerase family protein [Sneathiella sp.]MAL80074.1 enoyl-CoA hydratase [Sneathiella sp.]
MGYKNLTVTRDHRIVTVRIDRGIDFNPLSVETMQELTDVARSFEGDTEISAIILTGNGKNFTVGFDLKDPAVKARGEAGIMERREMLAVGPKMSRAWEELAPMTLVAIDGYCIGGGVALSVACDMRIASKDAVFWVPEIRNGMNMSWQSIPRMVNLMGPARTKQLCIVADKISAERAERWGLIEELAEPGKAYDLALDYARKIAAQPPLPVRMIKQGASVAANALNHAVSYMDLDQYAVTLSSEDYAEGINAFMEKREPEFRGR